MNASSLTSVEVDKFKIPVLNGKNYVLWSLKIKLILTYKGLWEFVQTNVSSASTTASDMSSSNERKKAQCLAIILLSIDDSYVAPVISMEDPKEVWEKLKSTYSSSSEAHIEALHSMLHEAKMGENESVVQFSNRIIGLRDQLSATGESVDQKLLIRVFLRGMPSAYKVEASIARQSFTTFDDVVSHLSAAEVREQCNDEKMDTGEDSAFVVPHNNCHHCGRPGHRKDKCFHNPKSSSYKPFFPSRRVQSDEIEKNLISF